MTARRALQLVVAGGLAWLAGCGGKAQTDPRVPAVDRQVRAKWGKPLAELPVVELHVISPHNENIANEFEWAFSLHHAVAHGQRVRIKWREVGGGSTAVLKFLQNVYSRSEASGIDVAWGGGDYNFQKLAADGILQRMRLSDDVLANIPKSFGGLEMLDANHRWCGSAVSGFGFLYNLTVLKRAGVAPPRRWDDLAKAEFLGRICLADPTQSGSAAAAYEMIVQTGETWPAGWAKLLAILGNANRFVDSAGGAANAPVVGEAAVATCIDFYGTTRVAEAPEELFYVSPRGQTAFNPDPIAILKNPPHAELAQRFVDFVLSRRGQALWALRVGEPDGPIRSALGRQPIRRDVYQAYADRMSKWIVNPYEAGNEMKLDRKTWQTRFGVLRQLVKAAAIDNRQFLRAARKRLIETGFEAGRLAEFNRLPDNVATIEALAEVASQLRDRTRSERIVTDWQRFFREKYRRVAD
jgi:ABC-type Fe3+ transport system substrate-binding protein